VQKPAADEAEKLPAAQGAQVNEAPEPESSEPAGHVQLGGPLAPLAQPQVYVAKLRTSTAPPEKFPPHVYV